MKLKTLATLLLLQTFLCTPRGASAQCTNINAQETVAWVNTFITSALGEDNACRGGAPDRDSFAVDTGCNIFVGRVMARMYGLNNFIASDGTFLRANDIAALLPTWNDWTDLGSAGDQAVLAAAADAAAQRYVVLAIWANPTPGKAGHVALIGPGPLTKSDKWNGLKTPVAASFKLDDAESAFLGQPLSCAFGADKKDAMHIWQYSKALSPQ